MTHLRCPFIVKLVESDAVSTPNDVGQGVLIPTQTPVDLPLYRREVRGFRQMTPAQRAQSRRNAIEEAKLASFEKFILSLQIIAEYEPYLSVSALDEKAPRRYAFLVSEGRWNRLRRQAAPTGGRSLRARVGALEFDILTHPRLNANEAYLVAAEKYLLYLRPRQAENGYIVSRSEFIDRMPDSGPPLSMRPERALRELFEASQTSSPAAADAENDVSPCPECGGKTVPLSAGAAFCLECEWDNLKKL